MGLFDSIFGSKEKGGGFKKIPQSEPQKRMEKLLEGLATGDIKFSPREIAGLSKGEKWAVDRVNQMIDKGGIPEISEAVDVVRRRMTEPITPETVPGVKGLFQKASELGARTLGRTKRGLALGGNLPSQSSPGERVFGRTWQDIQNEFITAASGLYGPFVSAKLNAPSELANLATQNITTPLAIAETTGAKPRTIQQQINDAIFEAMRMTQTFPYSGPMQAASTIYGTPSYTYQPPFIEPSPFSQVASFVGPLASAAIARPAAQPQTTNQIRMPGGYGGYW